MFALGFPLLLVPFAIYNIVAFLMPGVSWTGMLATVHMKSGADWAMSGGDILITFAILLLFVEMLKVVRIGSRGVVDHGLALLLFIAMLAEFVLVGQVASAIFFLLLVLSFFDVLGGFTLTQRSERPNVTIESSEAFPEIAEPISEKVEPEIIEPAPKDSEHVPS